MGHVLNECVYDAMVSTPNCKNQPFTTVKSIHYTVCQKPWECRKGENSLCMQFLHAWWLVRNDLEVKSGVLPRGRCCRDRAMCKETAYQTIHLNGMKQLKMNGESKVLPNFPIVELPREIREMNF